MSVKFNVALRLPVADGVNVTLTVQALLGGTVEPVQVSALTAKSPAFVPTTVTVETIRLPLPVLVMVSVWAALIEPMGLLPKLKPGADKLTMGAVPVPLKVTV